MPKRKKKKAKVKDEENLDDLFAEFQTDGSGSQAVSLDQASGSESKDAGLVIEVTWASKRMTVRMPNDATVGNLHEELARLTRVPVSGQKIIGLRRAKSRVKKEVTKDARLSRCLPAKKRLVLVGTPTAQRARAAQAEAKATTPSPSPAKRPERKAPPSPTEALQAAEDKVATFQRRVQSLCDAVTAAFSTTDDATASDHKAQLPGWKKEALVCDETLTQTLLKLDLVSCQGELRARRKVIMKNIHVLHKQLDATKQLLK